jgi:hypothetical protein
MMGTPWYKISKKNKEQNSKYCAMKNWEKNEKIQITNSPFHKNLYD